jgi:hypothetical protein
MKIICADSTIHAHQFFLKGIPFFEVALETIAENELQMKETSGEAFLEVLKFAYLGSLIELNSEYYFDLLLHIFSLAHNYMYEDLQQHIIHLLGNQLPPKTDLQHKCKALYQKGYIHENKDLMSYALKLMTYFESKDFYAFISSNFSLEEIKKLIEVARPMGLTQVISRLEKIDMILTAQVNRSSS